MSIRFENVHKAFGTRKILEGISFEVKRGEILFILGKSGVGKSVTLKHIVGALEPDAGKIFVDQYEVTSFFSKEKRHELQKVRKLCGMVFQHPALLDSLSNFENIAFGLRRDSRSEGEIEKIVHEKLELVHLKEEILPLFPFEVSYGVQKRISIARTLATTPDFLLFDEPTTGLDPLSTSSINDLIFELSRKLKVTSIIVSHDMACALSIADSILFLDQGKILLKAPPSEVIQSKLPLVIGFFEEILSLFPSIWSKN